MRVEAITYSKKLMNEFGQEAIIFNQILEIFDSKEKAKDTEAFNNFWKSHGTDEDCKSKICNWAYELYNDLRHFYTGGPLELFMNKQTEWGAPEVILKENDLPPSDIHLLQENQIVFRGMSEKEHKTKQYQQAWTPNKEIAKKFATDTYSYLKLGIVVKAVVQKVNILYYDKNNREEEVIIKLGSISDPIEIKA